MWRLSCMAMATNSAQRSLGKFCAYDAKIPSEGSALGSAFKQCASFRKT
jgi:hypothetical protein